MCYSQERDSGSWLFRADLMLSYLPRSAEIVGSTHRSSQGLGAWELEAVIWFKVVDLCVAGDCLFSAVRSWNFLSLATFLATLSKKGFDLLASSSAFEMS